MSDLLNQASLVVIPSGYKEDTVYSVVPSDGSGDLSFTRASNGTRINSAGLVEVCPWNLLQQSETFDNATWSKSGIAVTANASANPLTGLTNADNLVAENVNNFHYINQAITFTSDESTIFVYAKANGYTWFVIDTGLSNRFAYFNTTTGVVGTTGSSSTATIESVGNGWYKCVLSFTAIAGSSNIYLAVRNADNGGSFTGNGTGGILVYGAQLNIGSTAKPYFPTTDRLNVPRLTYQNGGGGCPSLLLEKQSTNLLTYSEDFTNSIWSKVELTVSGNSTTSPDGTQNADKLIPTTANSFHYTDTSSASVSSNALASVFAKKSGYQRFAIRSYFTGNYAIFDVNSGVVVATNGTTATIENYGNGWYRCSLNDTGSASYGYQIFVMENTSTSPTASYVGNGTDGLYFWGAQVEASSYPTSYIPTISASATRVKDLGNDDVFGTTYTLDADFCLFQDFECFDFANFPVFWSGGNYSISADYRSYMIAYSTTNITLFGVGEVTTAQLSAFTFAPNTRYKLAVRRVGSTISWFVNGVKYSNASGTTTTTVKIRSISGSSLGGQNVMKLSEAVIFEDATLTDADCISLTTI